MLSQDSFYEPKYQLYIKVCIDNSDVISYYKTFNNHYFGDSGIDLLTIDDISVDPFKVGTLDFQIQCEMIDMETNKFSSYYLVPRSSISKTNFMMANSIGIIDAGYRGNIMAKIRNCNFNQTEQVTKGERLFQIISPDMKPIRVTVIEELTSTTRNDSSFGSTNDK